MSVKTISIDSQQSTIYSRNVLFDQKSNLFVEFGMSKFKLTPFSFHSKNWRNPWKKELWQFVVYYYSFYDNLINNLINNR